MAAPGIPPMARLVSSRNVPVCASSKPSTCLTGCALRPQHRFRFHSRDPNVLPPRPVALIPQQRASTGRSGRWRPFASCSAAQGPDQANGAPAGSQQRPSPGADHIVKGISESAEVSVIAVVGTHLVQEAQHRHSLAPTAAAALGRLLMGTLLLGAKQGPGEVVQVSFNGRGPIGQMTALASDEVHAKGFVGNPACDPPLNAKGKLDVGTAVGPGVITVVRTHPSWQQAYTGTVPIQTGEIAEDLAHYLAESEQVNSALGLGVAVGRDGGVLAAGGFLVQVLPFCSEETLQLLERNVTALPAVSDLVQAGEDASAMIGRLLNGLAWRQAGMEVTPSFGPCGDDTLRPRMLQAVVALGKDEVDSILRDQGKVEVKCEFCAETVSFTSDDLEPLLEVATDV